MSETVLLTSPTRKVSSATIGLSNRANGCPEGSGTGRGGCGGQVCHHQAQGLGACKTCKKVGVVAECAYGTSTACAQCKSAKLRCGLVQGRHGQRKPTEAAGGSAAAVVVVKTTKSKLAISVFPSPTHRFDRREDCLAIGQGQPQQKGSLAHRGR